MTPATPPEPLEALLHRCHRDELLPLARVLRVDPTPFGLADLARNLARTLRRLGAHELANAALRGGEGPPYREVLERAAARLDVRGGSDEELELGIVRVTFASGWSRLPEAERERLWEGLGLALPAPAEGGAALTAATRDLGRAFGYRISRTVDTVTDPRHAGWLATLLLHPLGCLVRPFLLPLMPLVIAWRLRSDPERVRHAILEVARLRQVVLHRITVGVVGSPSTGKDAAIRALFGIETGNISPIAGSTKEVTIQQLPGATALYVVNTPGMGDVVERVTEEARQVLDHIDVYLYLVNAEGGVQARELADYRRCAATGKPVLVVVNKVDVLRERDRAKYLADARAKLGCAEEDFLACAFDPLPQLAPAPIGREAVHAWLARRLEEAGKDPGELPPLPKLEARG